MGRFFVFDLKRIFMNGRTVVLCIAVPLVVMLLFSSVIAPLLVTRSRVAASCFAVYNEDGTQVTKEFIDYVASSNPLKESFIFLIPIRWKKDFGWSKTVRFPGCYTFRRACMTRCSAVRTLCCTYTGAK
jgi:hypothetical protein